MRIENKGRSRFLWNKPGLLIFVQCKRKPICLKSDNLLSGKLILSESNMKNTEKKGVCGKLYAKNNQRIDLLQYHEEYEGGRGTEWNRHNSRPKMAALVLTLESPKLYIICKKKVVAKRARSCISHIWRRLKVTSKKQPEKALRQKWLKLPLKCPLFQTKFFWCVRFSCDF